MTCVGLASKPLISRRFRRRSRAGLSWWADATLQPRRRPDTDGPGYGPRRRPPKRGERSPSSMISAEGRQVAGRTRVSELRIPNLSEIDFGRLRTGRLARLQAMMKRHELPVCLFYSPANIRYATGTDVMGVWTAGTFARYALVPAEGDPILFEYKGSMHVSRKLVRDVRPAYTWQFGGAEAPDKAREWARSIRAVLRERGLEGERLAVDKLDTLGFLALQAEGIALADS